MASVDLDVFRQSQNWGIFLQKTYKNTQAGCKSRLLAVRVDLDLDLTLCLDLGV